MSIVRRFRDIVAGLDRPDQLLVSVPLAFGAVYALGAWAFETRTIGVAAAALAAVSLIGYGLVFVSPSSE